MKPRPPIRSATCLLILGGSAGAAPPPSGPIAIVPDPSYATPTNKLPPLPVPPAMAPQAPGAPTTGAPGGTITGAPAPSPVSPPVMPAVQPSPRVAQKPQAVPPVPLTAPAPSAAPPAALPPVRRTPTRAASREPGPAPSIGHYKVHREGASWRITPQGRARPVRGEVELARIRLAPSLARAAREGLVTLYVDGRLIDGRLIVTGLAGSVPDQPRRRRFRWWRREW